jgi:succinoglycan biosynthesis protein ExoM
MLISVCVRTYKRPSVVDTLASIAAQHLPDGWRLEFVVVDNDADGSAEPVVRAWSAAHTIAVRYDVVPGPNIAAARNRTLELARGDWIAFLDDDERANPTWLGHLIRTSEVYDADAVVGRVIALYPPSTPDWLCRADPLSRDWGDTGQALQTGSTANAIVRADRVREAGLRFDEGLGRTGGEDTDFFNRLSVAGARIVVCDEAVVAETVPPMRLEPAYLRKRALRAGQSYGQMHLRTLGGPGRAAILAASTAKAAGCLALSVGLARMTRATAWRLRIRGWLNVGKLRAGLGLPVPAMY